MRKTRNLWSSVRGILGISAALVIGGVGAGQSAAQTYNERDCFTHWNNAPADDYCPDATAGRVQTAQEAEWFSTTVGHCVMNASCSISVNLTVRGVAVDYVTYTPQMSDLLLAPADVGTIDICFAESDSSWTATVRAGCETGETDSDNATESGLPVSSVHLQQGDDVIVVE